MGSCVPFIVIVDPFPLVVLRGSGEVRRWKEEETFFFDGWLMVDVFRNV